MIAIQIIVVVIALILLFPSCMILCKRLAFAAMEDETSGPTDAETNRLEIFEKLVVKVSVKKVISSL